MISNNIPSPPEGVVEFTILTIMNIYPKNIDKYYQNISLVGTLDPQQTNVYTAKVGSKGQGAILELSLQLAEDSQHVEQAYFQAHGCGYLIAMANYVVEQLQGQSLDGIKDITPEFLINYFELQERKFYCAFMIEECLKNLITKIKQSESVS